MTVKIDKSVPIPKGLNGRIAKYPWHEMVDVGDSFFAPGKTSAAMLSSAKSWAKRNNPALTFSVRAVTENGVKGVRIWRTA